MVIAVVIEAYKKIIENDDDLSNIRKSKIEPIVRDSILIGRVTYTNLKSVTNFQYDLHEREIHWQRNEMKSINYPNPKSNWDRNGL